MNSDDGELAGLEGANFPGAEAALRRAAHVAHRRAEAATANTGKPLAFGTMAVPCGRSKSWWGGFCSVLAPPLQCCLGFTWKP